MAFYNIVYVDVHFAVSVVLQTVWVPSVEYLSDHARQLTVCLRLLLIFFCQSM